MEKLLPLLRRFVPGHICKVQAEDTTPFDIRLKKLDAVRPVNVARAVLFRTRPEHQEA